MSMVAVFAALGVVLLAIVLLLKERISQRYKDATRRERERAKPDPPDQWVGSDMGLVSVLLELRRRVR